MNGGKDGCNGRHLTFVFIFKGKLNLIRKKPRTSQRILKSDICDNHVLKKDILLCF